jgi:hypothetical protein
MISTGTNYSSDPLLDSIKPSKITSLTLKSVQSTNGQIQAILTWKAVGDDLDIGTGKYWKPYLSFVVEQLSSTWFSPCVRNLTRYEGGICWGGLIRGETTVL